MITQKSRNAVVVSLQFPEVVSAKPGLVEDLGSANAVTLMRLLAEQVLRQSLPVDDSYRGYILFTPKERTSEVQDWLRWTRGRAQLEWNEGQTHGERAAHALRYALEDGCNKVVLLETHCLEIRRSLLDQVFAALDENDAILGPAQNGGFYLIGLRSTIPPDLLTQLPWDSPNMCEAFCKELDQRSLEFEMLPDAVVVDNGQDLERVPAQIWNSLPGKTREALRLLGLSHLVADQTAFS